jgi:hypothetical protein
MKDGKPYYFNNIPPGKKCADPMPEGYLWYTGLLMSKVSLPEEKYRVAENVIRNNCINVAQLSNLLTYIDFEIEKLKLVRFAWPHVTDKKQGPVLEKDFRFDASLTELRKIISSAGTVPPVTADCRKPAAEEEIRSLTAQLNSVPNDQERYSTLKRSYAKYCYSAGQVKVLLLQFTHDREKLEAAKDLYFQCVEKDRFMTVAEVFSYNQTISELQQFISNQK